MHKIWKNASMDVKDHFFILWQAQDNLFWRDYSIIYGTVMWTTGSLMCACHHVVFLHIVPVRVTSDPNT